MNGVENVLIESMRYNVVERYSRETDPKLIDETVKNK